MFDINSRRENGGQQGAISNCCHNSEEDSHDRWRIKPQLDELAFHFLFIGVFGLIHTLLAIPICKEVGIER
ncbi:MAG: hypothetical protein ACRECH_14150 [Nitrososphaerales archaeon]